MEKKVSSLLGIKNIALFAGFLIMLNILYPSPFPKKFDLKPGDIAPVDVIAPHTFYIAKNKKELQEEREKARESVFSVIRKEPEVTKTVIENAMAFFQEVKKIRKGEKSLEEKRTELISIIPSLNQQDISILLSRTYKTIGDSLIKMLREVLEQGVIISKDSVGSPIVVILGEEKPIPVNNFSDIHSLPMIFKERANQMFPQNRYIVGTLVTTATFFIKPNLMIDLTEILKRREKAEAQVELTKGIVLKDEMIIRAHDIVTQEVVDKLTSLSQRAVVSRTRIMLGRNIIYLIALLVLFLSIYFLQAPLLDDFWKLFLLISLMCLIMAISSLVISKRISGYLIPIASFGILISLLLGIRVGLAGIMALTILIAGYSSGGFELVALFLGPGIISVFASSSIKRISDFYKLILYILAAYICIVLGVELVKFSPFSALLKPLGYAAIGGVGATFLAFGLLPLLERAFKITTPITLLEYVDLNRPLMRELSIYAPGTYHHSITVGNLAEAAARTIGANPLLARVGAYYHDIGKLKKPSYFIENQNGKNPHSKLSPELDALITISHVKEGVVLAEKEGLPKEITDIIREHQGTTLIEPFYAKAKERKEEVNELDFRYPGPLPHTKESAIVMLADAIEATARSLQEPTSSRLRGVIKDIIKKRLDDGQLSKVNLSLEELKKIGDSFFPILIGIFHPRIEYAKNLHKESKEEPENKRKEI
ncbi:HDIG domain-containing protein [candidate division WOR-3 bacterium]|nr:HDIG domain-containing protein [candidate division WOR-3 bacterium]